MTSYLDMKHAPRDGSEKDEGRILRTEPSPSAEPLRVSSPPGASVSCAAGVYHVVLEHLADTNGPDRAVDWALHGLGGPWGIGAYGAHPHYTANVDDATRLIERYLPGFWHTSGLCSLSGHASIGPDYNGPDGDRLRVEWPEDQFHSGFDADWVPGSNRAMQACALMDCLLQALRARASAGDAAEPAGPKGLTEGEDAVTAEPAGAPRLACKRWEKR